MAEEIICLLCGRKGTRSYTVLSGSLHTDPGRVSWRCSNFNACERRQRVAEREMEVAR